MVGPSLNPNSAAYMERQKMAVCISILMLISQTPHSLQFHSDSEVGLGPLVAGLSLGSPALIHFRLHAKHDPIGERRGILLSIVLRHVRCSTLHWATSADLLKG